MTSYQRVDSRNTIASPDAGAAAATPAAAAAPPASTYVRAAPAEVVGMNNPLYPRGSFVNQAPAPTVQMSGKLENTPPAAAGKKLAFVKCAEKTSADLCGSPT